MVAYHFPQLNVSSGIQRTLRFAQYLPEFGWEPAILSAHPRSYGSISPDADNEVPERLLVRRAFALDTARHLAVRGYYSRLLCIPDRWWTWFLGAVPAGLSLIRSFRPDVLWTTYPIATAHVIGDALHRLTGVPWVADFRDPMAQEGYPPDPLTHRAFRWIERRAIDHAQRAVFTAPGALRLYAERYPNVPRERLAVIENGYDETAFDLARSARGPGIARDRPLTLLHSGTIYESERDPRAFLAAVGGLRRDGRLSAADLRIVLRATGCDDYLAALIAREEIHDMVELAPGIPYAEALAEMISADGLLVLQAANCNDQVPAKLYEYLAARRPILALTDPAGDTAGVLRRAGIDTIARLDSVADIREALVSFVGRIRAARAPIATESAVVAASRRGRTSELAALLDGMMQ